MGRLLDSVASLGRLQSSSQACPSLPAGRGCSPDLPSKALVEASLQDAVPGSQALGRSGHQGRTCSWPLGEWWVLGLSRLSWGPLEPEWGALAGQGWFPAAPPCGV